MKEEGEIIQKQWNERYDKYTTHILKLCNNQFKGGTEIVVLSHRVLTNKLDSMRDINRYLPTTRSKRQSSYMEEENSKRTRIQDEVSNISTIPEESGGMVPVSEEKNEILN